MAFFWYRRWLKHRAHCLVIHNPRLFIGEGLLIVNLPLVHLKQRVSIFFGDNFAGEYQFTIVDLPFIVESLVAFGPSPRRHKGFWARNFVVGAAMMRPRDGGAEVFCLLLPIGSFLLLALPTLPELPVAAVRVLLSSLAVALGPACEDELVVPSP